MSNEEIVKGEFCIDLPQFKKWNPDMKKSRHWFALSVHFQDDPKIRALSAVDERLYLRLLSLRARFGQPLTNITATYLQRQCNIQGRSIQHALVKLSKLGLIDLYRQTDRQTDRDENSAAAEDSPKLTPKNLEILRKEFGEKLVEEHLKSALATWEAYPPYRQSQILPIQTVQRYLRNVKKDEAEKTKLSPTDEALKNWVADFGYKHPHD